METDRIRLLIVDDEPIVVKRLRQIFEKVGYQVAVFTQGRPALEDLHNNAYDIVVTDLRMEDVDGMKILEAARGKNPGIKVIIITAFAEMETAREAFRKGVFDFITKPFQIDTLKQAIFKAEEEIRSARKS
jgi:DNA-binding NtrC family response regulator